MNITIRSILTDDILANDKVRYNTNNHWDATSCIKVDIS